MIWAKLSDMDVGTVAYDRDGDTWTRTERGATFKAVTTGAGAEVEWEDLDEADKEFGPFYMEDLRDMEAAPRAGTRTSTRYLRRPTRDCAFFMRSTGRKALDDRAKQRQTALVPAKPRSKWKR